jgi:hypothetical protein
MSAPFLVRESVRICESVKKPDLREGLSLRDSFGGTPFLQCGISPVVSGSTRWCVKYKRSDISITPYVREGGLEPPRLVSATPSRWCVCHFATPAGKICKNRLFYKQSCSNIIRLNFRLKGIQIV